MTALLAISDAVLNTFLAGVFGLVLTWMNYKFERDKKVTAKKLGEMSAVADDTHKLVNSNMGEQLRLNADLSRWKANQTKLGEDERVALLAEKKLQEHEAKQRRVDG
jgi:hypothetical protein